MIEFLVLLILERWWALSWLVILLLVLRIIVPPHISILLKLLALLHHWWHLSHLAIEVSLLVVVGIVGEVRHWIIHGIIRRWHKVIRVLMILVIVVESSRVICIILHILMPVLLLLSLIHGCIHFLIHVALSLHRSLLLIQMPIADIHHRLGEYLPDLFSKRPLTECAHCLGTDIAIHDAVVATHGS